ncbi:hypothetical protein DENSPDRAFT_838864 [Dentipellis sp. KUC8613]|nr:hypothetical protein DENSPDRAFT_838864 [Dentipellis sp. KUC8613]
MSSLWTSGCFQQTRLVRPSPLSGAPCDLHIPVSPLSGNDKSIKAILSRTWQNYRNALVNARCMHMIAKDSMFPNVYVKRPLSLNTFHARSTRDNAWVAPLRATFLDTYEKVNTAIATGDVKTLKSLTTVDYQKTAMERLRALHPKAGTPYTYQWKLHELRSPVRIESVRASETYMSQQEPKTGSRLLAQMLVRFDSTQTLERFRNGQLVKGAGQTTPKPVVEYLVFEKRMWYDGPWVIREQIYEGA